MYSYNNFSLVACEKDNVSHVTRWANDALFKSINVNKHKLNSKTIETLLANLPSSTQLLMILMNKELIGFCEMYKLDYSNRVCNINIYLNDKEKSFVLHGYNLLGMICTYLYTITGINKIVTELMLDDAITISIFKQRNFKIEVHRRAHALVSGSYKTIAELSLLRADAKL